MEAVKSLSIILLLMLAALTVQAQFTSMVPPLTYINWTNYAGVVGGIPARNNIFVNCLTGACSNGIQTAPAFTCHADDVHDDSAIITAAINACPSNWVVYLPAATYLITNTITATYSHCGWTLRGDGAGTVLHFDSPNDSASCMDFGTITYRNTNSAEVCGIYSGTTLGSTTIAVSNTAGNANTITVGMLLQIDQLNTNVGLGTPETSLVTPFGSDTFSSSYDRGADGTRLISQIVQVSSIFQLTNITFQPSLVWNFDTAMSPQAAQMAASGQAVGLENFKIQWDAANNKGEYSIRMDGMVNSWITNVESANTKRWHFFLVNCLDCTFADNYLHDGIAFGINNGYGFELSFSTACLCENNIVSDCFAPWMFDGPTGCVIDYNYIVDDQPAAWNGYQASGLCTHAPHAMMNLWEGNVTPNFEFDHTHGSSSHQTLFRNAMAETNTAVIQHVDLVTFSAWSQSNNVVGNVIGDATRSYIYSAPTNDGYSDYGQNYAIFHFGYPDISPGTGFGGTSSLPLYPLTNYYDLRVTGTTTITGNYDYATGTTIWANAYHTLPASLCYASKPAWWTAGLAWPPIGPDLTPMVSIIPAQMRFQQLAMPKHARVQKP